MNEKELCRHSGQATEVAMIVNCSVSKSNFSHRLEQLKIDLVAMSTFPTFQCIWRGAKITEEMCVLVYVCVWYGMYGKTGVIGFCISKGGNFFFKIHNS